MIYSLNTLNFKSFSYILKLSKYVCSLTHFPLYLWFFFFIYIFYLLYLWKFLLHYLYAKHINCFNIIFHEIIYFSLLLKLWYFFFIFIKWLFFSNFWSMLNFIAVTGLDNNVSIYQNIYIQYLFQNIMIFDHYFPKYCVFIFYFP